ncbi:MAG TPA: hemerythrin family protein [Thermoanaerobaculia bacterium]|nr:hemerythrin family protein [Thermoanaerobaculia bacterium]
MADLPGVLRLGIPELDTEHFLQAQILASIRDALAGDDWAQASDLVRQLQDVTEAHFMAEHLLMRLHAYPSFQLHEREHDQLIDELRSLEESVVSGEAGLDPTIRTLELWLVHHIHTADKAFAIYLAERRGLPASFV